MDDDILQVRGQLEILSGGYGREDGDLNYYPIDTIPDNREYIEWDQNYTDWKNVPAHSQATTYYVYSDSNVGLNSQSTKVRVRVTDIWDMEIDPENVMTINVQTFIESVARYDKRGNAYGSRGLYAFDPRKDGTRGAEFWKALNSNVGVTGPIGGTPSASIYTTFVLAPGQASESSTITFRNVTTGFEAQLFRFSPYVDAIRIGLRFKNGLPTDLPIPIFKSMTQTEDICENFVNADLEFEPINVNGAAIYLEWRYEGQDWAKERATQIDVYRGTPIHVPIYQLAPTNHTASPVHVYWRAKFVPVSVKMKESDWAYGDFYTIYVPAPHMTVPDISPAECSAIQKGEFIPWYTHEQCYNEFGCADQDDLRSEMLAEREKDNKDCIAMNKEGGK